MSEQSLPVATGSRAEPRAAEAGKLGARQLCATLRWLIGELYQESPRSLLFLVGMILTQAAIPPLLVLLVSTLATSALSGELPAAALSWWAAGAFAILYISSLLVGVRTYVEGRLSEKCQRRLTSAVLAHASRLDLPVLENLRAQDMLYRALQTPARAFLMFVPTFCQQATNGLQAVLLLGVMFWLAPGVVSLLALVLLPCFWLRWVLARSWHEMILAKTRMQRLSRYYTQKLTDREDLPTIKLLRLGPLFVKRFRDAATEMMKLTRPVYRRNALIRVLISTLMLVGLGGCVAWTINAGVNGLMSAGAIAGFWLAAMRFQSTLQNLLEQFQNGLDSLWTASQLHQFLQLQPVLRDGVEPRPAPTRGCLELRDVTYAYAGSSRPTLENVSLRIEAGETVAIVGHIGAGKSTLVKLLARLYDPTEGTILLDGLDLKAGRLEDVHRQIAYVPQLPTRFEATAHDNIAFGNWDLYRADRAGVAESARLMNVDALINKLPAGYDTHLGRLFGAQDLSGGQWQRLAITRALAKDAPIIILDEPVANLDVQAEMELYERLRELTRGKTAILISHRFATVRLADRIFVIDSGRLIEQGSHEELLRLDGMYAKLYRVHSTLAGVAA